LHVKLPDLHLDENTREVAKVEMGLIATISALVLSLFARIRQRRARPAGKAGERRIRSV